MPPHPDAVAFVEKHGRPRSLLHLTDPDDPRYDPRFVAVVGRKLRGEPEPVRAVSAPPVPVTVTVTVTPKATTAPPRRSPSYPGPCEHRDRCGCRNPLCLDAVRGPRYGTPETQLKVDGTRLAVYRVGPAACWDCAASAGHGL